MSNHVTIVDRKEEVRSIVNRIALKAEVSVLDADGVLALENSDSWTVLQLEKFVDSMLSSGFVKGGVLIYSENLHPALENYGRFGTDIKGDCCDYCRDLRLSNWWEQVEEGWYEHSEHIHGMLIVLDLYDRYIDIVHDSDRTKGKQRIS